MSARSKARKQALDLLFEADIRGTNALETLNLRDIVEEGPDARPIREYTRSLISGVSENTRKIDELITTYAQGWDMDRLPNVDRNILRLAIYEILWASDLGVIESRIVTNHWIYLIRPPNQGWPSVDTIERIDIEIDNDVSLDYCITQPNSNPEWLHMRYEVLSRRSGFHYFRDKYS